MGIFEAVNYEIPFSIFLRERKTAAAICGFQVFEQDQSNTKEFTC
jgi:hypothetical protein